MRVGSLNHLVPLSRLHIDKSWTFVTQILLFRPILKRNLINSYSKVVCVAKGMGTKIKNWVMTTRNFHGDQSVIYDTGNSDSTIRTKIEGL